MNGIFSNKTTSWSVGSQGRSVSTKCTYVGKWNQFHLKNISFISLLDYNLNQPNEFSPASKRFQKHHASHWKEQLTAQHMYTRYYHVTADVWRGLHDCWSKDVGAGVLFVWNRPDGAWHISEHEGHKRCQGLTVVKALLIDVLLEVSVAEREDWIYCFKYCWKYFHCILWETSRNCWHRFIAGLPFGSPFRVRHRSGRTTWFAFR